MTSTDIIIVGLALLSFVAVTVVTHPRTWSWPARFARWVWGLNGCVKRWGWRGGPFTKEQLETLRMVSRHPSAADVEIGMHGRTHRGAVGHLAHVAANAIIQGASHDARELASRGVSHTAPIPEGTFRVGVGSLRGGDFRYGDAHVGDLVHGTTGTGEQNVPTGPEEDTTLGEDSDGFLIKVADRLPLDPDLEKCDAFVSTLGAAKGSGGFSVSSHPVAEDDGDTVWGATMRGGNSSGVIVFAHEDVAIIVDVVAHPGLQDRIKTLARIRDGKYELMTLTDGERSAIEWIRANLRHAAAERILGMLGLENVAVRPATKEPARRALDLKGDDDDKQERPRVSVRRVDAP